MSQMDLFIQKLLAAAKAAGVDPAEVCYVESSSFSVEAMEGKIEQYEVSSARQLGLRGAVEGRMGYASTEAFDDGAIAMLVSGVKDSAALAEAEEQEEIYGMDDAYPELTPVESDIDGVSPEDKIAMCLRMEEAAKAFDARISKSQGAFVGTSRGLMRLVNSKGLDLTAETPQGGILSAGVFLVAKDGDSTTTGGHFEATRRVGDFDPVAVGQAAAEEAVSQLHARPVESGVYKAVLRWDVMQAMLATFSGVFSAENAQKKLSLLAGREGETIAAPCVTLIDDPLLPGGMATAAFDADGAACRTKAVIRDGVLETLLHNRKTAKKQGVETTGNASRTGVGGPVRVAPTNLFLQPGTRSAADLIRDMDDGLLITDISGLHAGANPISGDFSLIARGFLVVNGEIGRPVEQITVAGNFYQLLKEIREVGSDLIFQGRSIGSPSVAVEAISVSGADSVQP